MYRLAAVGLLLCPAVAQAHSFGRLYTLPVPLWMYAWGASAALVISFLVVAWFATHDPQGSKQHQIDLGQTVWGRALLHKLTMNSLAGLSLAAFALCIATGLFGTRNAYLNFNMTFFWIVFLLGFTYFTALFGGLYSVINPWLSLCRLFNRLPGVHFRGQYAYPKALGSWPALLLYMLFIWVELFSGVGSYALAWMLAGYAGFNLLGAWLFGRHAWFRHVEFFSLLFRLISKMAPLQYIPASDTKAQPQLVLRKPFVGLLDSKANSLSELVFVLFVLSSTAFDGLHQTKPWVDWYWQDIATLLQPWTGSNIVHAYPLLNRLHAIYQSAALLLSPFLYLFAYLACLALMRKLVHCNISLYQLALRFAYSLLPIALVYHITHYYTLVLTQGAMILRLASDPFGFGWNLFGTAHMLPEPVIPNMDWVWHTQVWLILVGHVVSVYLAHKEAIAIFPNRRDALVSQLPMLVLMVGFTCFGLWILAQPITSTIVQ
ncbi:MAG: hypothetical protein ACPHER_03360 [Nevskiales bacterium]